MAKKSSTPDSKAPRDPKAGRREDADGRLTALVERNYGALRTIAHREITARKLARTITPTSLVAETVMRLMRQESLPRSTPQLCGLATILMTRALSDRSRRSRARKRGSARKPIELHEELVRDRRTGARTDQPPASKIQDRLLSSLERLSKQHPREMEIITLRLVLGLPMKRVSELLSVPERTAYRELKDGIEILKRDLGWSGE